MSVSINKDTKVYCSFSQKAGNKGCEFFNKAFENNKVNAIYKSFSVNNIYDAIDAAKILNFSGFAVAMPYKRIVYEFIIDSADDSAIKSQAVNTVIIDSDYKTTIGYNTDYIGALKLLTPHRKSFNKIFILGNGGLSGAVQAASLDLGFEIEVITRKNWSKLNELKNSLVYNCTPLANIPDGSNEYIDCLIGSYGGDLLNKYQANKQFELYTGIVLND